MKTGTSEKGMLTKSSVLRGALLVFPFLLLFAALVLGSLWGWQYLRNEYPAFSLLVRPQQSVGMLPSDSQPNNPSVAPPDDTTESFVPVVYLEQKWAVLNVEGWKKTDIPVIFGQDRKTLKKGAGTWSGSRLCGQDGKLVLCAHVTTWFYELETTPIGTEVTLQTDYGKYIYRVRETLIFENTDQSILKNTDGEEVLVLYTCYPRSVGYRYTSKRMALICELVEGKTWVER